MFSVGQYVRATRNHAQVVGFNEWVDRISHGQRFKIIKEVTFSNGRQFLWVEYSPKSPSTKRISSLDFSTRGPFMSEYFMKDDTVSSWSYFLPYDPTQQGDTDDDI